MNSYSLLLGEHLDRLLCLVSVRTVVITLNLVLDLLHLLNLSPPLLSTHLALLAEELSIRCAVGSSNTIPQCEVLAVVVVEVKVVHGVASRSVDDWGVHNKLSVVDQNRPHIDEDEQSDISDLLEREDEWEDVVWDRLRKAVKWVESVRRKRCRHNPLVVWLMQLLVNGWVVKTAVDPIDEEVGEDEEEWELEPLVPRTWPVGRRVVESRVPAGFENEAGCCQGRHDGHGGVGLNHLELDLVLKELWVCEGCVVKDQVVGRSGNYEVEEKAEEPGMVLVNDLWVGCRVWSKHTK